MQTLSVSPDSMKIVGGDEGPQSRADEGVTPDLHGTGFEEGAEPRTLIGLKRAMVGHILIRNRMRCLARDAQHSRHDRGGRVHAILDIGR